MNEHENIAQRAYFRWQHYGGEADQNWREAEFQLSREPFQPKPVAIVNVVDVIGNILETNERVTVNTGQTDTAQR